MSIPTIVKINLGYTRNMGNFESARVDIGIEDYVRDTETIDKAVKRVYDFVESKLVEKVNELEAEIKKANG